VPDISDKRGPLLKMLAQSLHVRLVGPLLRATARITRPALDETSGSAPFLQLVVSPSRDRSAGDRICAQIVVTVTH
jgi:hypothetical protein